MKIILVRHAEPDYTIDSLTEKGWGEAKLLIPRIQKLENVKNWYMSPLGRAMDTAHTALTGTGIEPEILPWAREFAGQCADPRDGHIRHAWDFYPEDWTKYDEMYDKDNWVNCPLYEGTNVKEERDKVVRGLDELLLKHGYRRDGRIYRVEESNDYTIVIFCHMIVSLLMIGHLTGISAPLLWHGFFAAPSTFFEIQTEERVDRVAQFRVRALGDYSHLYTAGEPVSDSGFKKEKQV